MGIQHSAISNQPVLASSRDLKPRPLLVHLVHWSSHVNVLHPQNDASVTAISLDGEENPLHMQVGMKSLLCEADSSDGCQGAEASYLDLKLLKYPRGQAMIAQVLG